MQLQYKNNKFVSLFRKSRKTKTWYLAGILAVLFVAIKIFSPTYLTEVAVVGGGFSEGMVGYPRFINPVLALSQTDKDLSSLIFSGMFRQDEEGVIVKDLAESYSVNASSTEYTVILRENLEFHDGSPLTTADVDFTYKLIADPVIKSYLSPQLEQVNWRVVDERTIVFSLRQAKENFLNSLSIGILSADQWQGISSEEFPFATYNISPVGSGPYQISDINRNSDERITSYVLSGHPSYPRPPYIDTLEIKFYPDQRSAIAAFEAGLIDNMANISPQELLLLDHTLESKNIQSYPLDRSFALYFNPRKQSLFENTDIRRAIDETIDREEIIKNVFFGRADQATGPIPLSHPYYLPPENEIELMSPQDIAKSFAESGWQKNNDGIYANASTTLSFTLHTPEVEELVKTADIIKDQLFEIGIEIVVIPVEQGEIINNTIRQREYELLLFGQLSEDANSLYAFWHSDGIEDPGINIAGFSSKTLDTILERITSQNQNADQAQIDYENLQKEIRKNHPAVFLYHPHFIYALDERIHNAVMGDLRFAWDRFNDISQWYIKTELLLPWFID